ncbi:MAG: FAD-dependent oxidoreductase [Coriobacteriia bacterium]
MEQNLVSRRRFVQGLALAAVGAGASALLPGCDSDKGGNAAKPDSTDDVWSIGDVAEPSETKTAEVVVIGGGGTGLAAAIQCSQLGLKPLVIEQLGSYGGSFVGTEVIDGVTSDIQKTYAVGIEDSLREAYVDHMKYHHYIPRHRLVKNFIDQIPETIDWLSSNGIQFDGAVGYKNRALAYIYGDQPTRGAMLIKVLGEKADSLGIDALFNTRARKILVEEGKVAGVLVEKNDGSVIRVDTSAVIVGTGGYSNNKAFLEAVAAVEAKNIQALGIPCRNADGIKMAADAGAAMAEGMGTIQWCGPVIIGAVTASWQTGTYVAGGQPQLWVNEDAQRFINEDLILDNFPASGVCVRNEKQSFILFTDADLDYWEKTGPYASNYPFAPQSQPLKDVRSTIKDLESCHVGDSIEAVASAAGLDPAALRATVDRYNSLCNNAQGLDPKDTSADQDFGKQAQFMRAITEGPFWLCEHAAAYFATHGGIKVNENAEVLDKTDTVIKGLYSGGNDAGGIHGDSYDFLFLAGSTSAWAIGGGRMAAKAAARYLKA